MKQCLVFIFLLFYIALLAQAPIQIKGMVQNIADKKPLSGASIVLLKIKQGTTTDDAGNFSLLTQASLLPDTLLISYLGYEPVKISVSSGSSGLLFIRLRPKTQPLSPVFIYGISPTKLLEEAVLRIPSNYDTSVTWLRGKYEALEKEDTSITRKLEALVQIKRQAFNKKRFNDSAEIQTSHIVESRKGYFKSSVNLNALLQRDAVKNSKSFLEKRNFEDFDYEMGGVLTWNGRSAFLIRFDQKAEDQKYTGWKGEIYIDSASLAFVKISYGISPKGRGHRTLPWELALYGRIRKGFSMQLVVHDVNTEYEFTNGRWTLKEISWMTVTNWESSREAIPKYQMKLQSLRVYAADRSQTNRQINKTKFYRPGLNLEQIAPYTPEYWEKESPRD